MVRLKVNAEIGLDFWIGLILGIYLATLLAMTMGVES